MRKDFTGPLNAAMRSALEYLERLDDRPVGPTASLEELRQRFCREWNAEGAEPKQVIEELVREVDGGLNNSPSARFYAWVIGGTLPSALAADWMTSTWDQNAGMYTVSPASAVVEEAVGEWLKQLFHLPKQTSFALVTGCQMAHTTCTARMGRRTSRHGRFPRDHGLMRSAPRHHRPNSAPAGIRRRFHPNCTYKT
jgi:glutamate/tyrosine decarboxylase-like PLP-dependent enzyme